MPSRRRQLAVARYNGATGRPLGVAPPATRKRPGAVLGELRRGGMRVFSAEVPRDDRFVLPVTPALRV